MCKYLNTEIQNFLNKQNICLIGFMGAGKSIFGKLLAEELNLEIFDTDLLIEQHENKTIYEIFSEKGEKYFRFIEKKILQDIVYSTPIAQNGKKRLIITGGGLPLKRTNQNLLKIINTLNICLNPPFETIFSRIRGSKRPLVYRRSRTYIFNLWSERYKTYQKIADITISETEINEIFKTLNERVKLYNETNI